MSKIRTILASVLMFGIVIAALSMGTFSCYFSDTEASVGNTFTAGTRDLTLSDDDETNADGVTATWTASNMKPGDTGVATLFIKNAGTLDGYIDLSNIVVTDSENGINEPESEFDDTPAVGELSLHLKIQLWLDTNDNKTLESNEQLIYKGAMKTIEDSYELDELIEKGSVKNLAMAWRLAPSPPINVVQSDSATLTMTVELNQTAAE